MSETTAENLLDVVAYWHRIEFFIPFDLKEIEEKVESISLRFAELGGVTAEKLWQIEVEEGKEVSRFDLYLGVFGKSEIDRIGRHLRPGPATRIEADEDRERGDTEGNTCFARLTVTARGEPQFGDVSVSTVPWAIGCVYSGKEALLTDQNRETAFKELRHLLDNEAARRRLAYGEGKEPPLNGADIQSLIRLLFDWADFTPTHELAAVVKPALRDKQEARNEAAPPEAGEPEDSDASIERPDSRSEIDTEAAEEGKTAAEADREIDILNSFFIQDLERVMAGIRGGEVPATLASYLIPSPERLDLYSKESEAGRRAILDKLHPRRMPLGRWPQEPGRAMSLMQQFAINTALDHLAEEGLFSVNGPPGTGKTTLLGDIFAEIIVRRARALAGFNRVEDTIVERDIEVAFSGLTKRRKVVRPAPALLGHEIVVASSNNTAVENISKDLPKRKNIDKALREKAAYLRPVAHKVAIQQGKTFKEPKDRDDAPWGLISCTLGRRQNRRNFAERMAFWPSDKDKSHDRKRPRTRDPAQTISEWIKQYDGPSFSEARKAFEAADSALRNRISILADDADLMAEMLSQDGKTALDTVAARVETAAAEKVSVEARLSQTREELAQCETRLTDLVREQQLIDRLAPGLLARLLRSPDYRSYRERVRANSEEQLACLAQRSRLETELKSQVTAVAAAEAAFDAAVSAQTALQAEWTRKSARWSELQSSCRLSTLADLDQDDIQIRGLWHDRDLAEMRSALFRSALALHEAWLAEIAGKGFWGNLFAITDMLKGARPDTDAHAKLIWRSLFLVVPVVSSTFASFGNQFNALGPGDIGWLFVDEAGQAPPQAAVGALWRAKRAVVVGDPLQIEPIFTVPTRLIDALSERADATRNGQYAPNRVSAQQLADRANPFGAMVPAGDTGETIWIGSPLRVHRRCVQPMFEIANTIAYDGKMIFATASGKGKAAWIDLAGEVRGGRQVVPEQIELVTDAVFQLYRQNNQKLPNLYVISPFRSIKAALLEKLRTDDRWQDFGTAPSRSDLRDWCSQHIGTVHTFQGKEQETVFFVLGADQAHSGSADWASSKPNLLNVAVTRAQRAFYVIGDRSLWAGKRYFGTADSKLDSVSPQEFLQALGSRSGEPRPSQSLQARLPLTGSPS
ncbi:hypothetical protein KXS07_31910 [Inquilinus limosus]|uniref:DEAD/DEAH box helicase n=1 Tax=Inquilinus limosus TaxID=171674 RepID=UPI003F13F438